MPARRRFQYQALASSLAPVVVTVVALDWFSPLSEPIQLDVGLHPADKQSLSIVGATPTVRSASWYRPLSEPVRVKPRVAWQQPFTTDPTTPAAAFVYTPTSLSDPVQIEPGLSAAWNQYTTGIF